VKVAAINEDGNIGSTVELNEALREHARSAIAPREQSVGSVVGVREVPLSVDSLTRFPDRGVSPPTRPFLP
jgi:hypothetical protein